jgi:hypothetical protein
LTDSTTFEGPRAELEMWHPTGAPRRRLALGHHAGADSCGDDGPVDFALVAPSPVETDREWLEQAIALATRRLDGGGVLWIIVPRRWRRTAERAVARGDLVLLDAVLAIPRWPHSTHFVPIVRDALRDAGPRHLGMPRAASWLIGSLVGVGAFRRLLRRAAPGCALLAAREPGLPIFKWLGDEDGAGAVTATVSSGPRRDARVAVVLRFSARRRGPDLVVKAALDGSGERRVRAERAALERIGPTAAGTGAAVPVLKACPRPWALATDPLAGRSAADALASAPRRLEPIAGVVAGWLQRWNLASASRAVASADILEEMLLGPVRRLVADGTASESYANAMEVLAGRLQGGSLVVVAAHGDLTMSNVLLTAGPAPGILDWESAIATGLPLADLWYALADAVARAGRVSHAAAVEALVIGARPAPAALAQMPTQHAAALRLSVDQAMLAFHACWVAHAYEELRRGVADGSFAGVVRTVAARRLLWPRSC